MSEQWTYRLDVPYVPQQGDHANYRLRDCGAACAVMLARYRYVRDGYLDPVSFTVDDFARKTHLAVADSGLTCEQLVALLKGYGLNAEVRRPLMLDVLQGLVRECNPPILLVNYKYVNKAHKGDMGHFVVAVGYNATPFLVHDPYLLGANVTVANADLMAGMRDVLHFTPMAFQGVVLEG